MDNRSDLVFLVMAPAYDENSGGITVLHYLVDRLRKLKANAFLVPLLENHLVNTNNQEFVSQLLNVNQHKYQAFEINQNWDTPWLPYDKVAVHLQANNAIVVYPEIVRGNPLGAPRVARWCLHRPGFISRDFCFLRSEVLFKYDDWIDLPPEWDGFFKFGGTLFCNYAPFDHFGRQPLTAPYEVVDSSEICFAIRKNDASFEPIFGIANDSINIDGMHRSEIARVFSACKRFVSFDHNTFFSELAVLSGCESIVVPTQGKPTRSEFDPDDNRPYIAYGLDDLARSIKTSFSVVEKLDNFDARTEQSVLDFINYWRLNSG